MVSTIRSIFASRLLNGFRLRSRARTDRRQLSVQHLEDRTVPATYIVNVETDDITGAGGVGLTGDLRYCITQANANAGADIINFDAGMAGKTIFLGAVLSVTGAVDINGPALLGPADPNLTIDGASAFQIFNVTTGAGVDVISMKNLRLANGSVGNSGGAILLGSVEDTYNLTDMIFDANKGANYGGAIGSNEPASVDYGIVNITRAKFTHNLNTLNFGGALALNEQISGTGITKGWTANIIDVTFDSNQNERNGGALFFRGYSQKINITNTTFSNNKLTSDGYGGAISILSGAGSQSSTYTFTSCTFSGNQNLDIAPGGGLGGYGGVFGNGGAATPNIIFRNSTFTLNTAVLSGGVFAASSGSPNITFESSILYGNSGLNTEFEGGLVSAKFSIIQNKSGAASFTDNGNNKFGASSDPLLGPLGNSLGGLTQYHVPGSGSPARENGFADVAVTTDQRGGPRLLGSKVDIGSIESQDPTPIASANVSNVLTPSVSDYTFTVTYSDDIAILASSIGTGDVKISGPNGFSATPTFVSVDVGGNGTPRTATYKFTPPVNGAAGWDSSDNGVYTVTMEASQVQDTDTPTHFVPAGTLTTFTAGIPSTFTVNALGDAGVGVGNSGDLRYVVGKANSAVGAIDNIVFDAALFSTPQTITLAGTELQILEGVNITGPGGGKVTVSGGGLSRVFAINGPGTYTVSISGITVSGGNSSGNGGAFAVNDELLSLTNVIVSGNTANGDAGAVAIDSGGGKLIAVNSTFSGNSATTNGGALAINANATITLTGCTVEGNSANNGGAIDLNLGQFIINNSLLANNVAALSGGAVNLTNILGTLRFSNSTLSGNKAMNGSGGAINTNHGGGTLDIRNSTITNNSAVFGGGGILNSGGAVQPGNMNIVSSIISGNTSTTADLDVAAVTVVFGNTLLGSTAGGGVFDGSAGPNPPTGAPAGLAPLTNNGGLSRTHGLLTGSAAVDAGANPDGLAFDQRGTPFSRVVNGVADIGAHEGLVPVPVGTMTPIPTITAPGATPNKVVVTYTDETGINVATIDTGDIEILAPDLVTKLAITGVTVTPAGNGTPRIATYTFTPPVNSAAGWDQSDNGNYTVTLLDGAVSDIDSPTPNKSLQVVLGTIKAAIPNIYLVDEVSDVIDGDTNPGKMSIREAILFANSDAAVSAIVFDAAKFSSAKTITLTSGEMSITAPVTITGPAAQLTLDAVGASRFFNIDDTTVTNAAGLVTISNMVMINATFAGTGGAIFVNDDDLSLINVRITNSSATEGGAIYVGFANTSNATLTLTNSTISNNTATAGDGGGINLNGANTVHLLNTTVSGNSASANGGGLYWLNNGGATVTNSTISGNTAGGGVGGGGFYFFGTANGTGIVFTNSTISGNSAANQGGGIVLNSFAGKATINNSTITLNQSTNDGGGLVHTSAAINISSTIIAGNSAKGSSTSGTADLFTAVPVTTVTGANNLIGINDATTKFTFNAGTNPLIGTTTTKIDPQLAALALNGAPAGAPLTHAIAATSPAKNAGNNAAGLATDQRGAGFPRVVGPAADIGSFEDQTAANPTVVGTPIVNGGNPQRSRITSVTVNFDMPVTIAQFTSGGGSVVFTRTAATSTGTVGTVVQTGAVGANGLVTVTQPGPNTSLTFTFSNADASNISAGVDYNSLADGRWRLVLTTNSTPIFTSPLNDTNLRRLFGDFEGAPGSNGTVDAGDFGAFGAVFGTSGAPGFSPFDFDNNGTIDAGDLGAFGARFGFSV